MSAATPLRIGQTNGAGDVDSLFLKVYGGEVLTAFETLNVMQNLQMVRNIASGKSAQFPATWKVNASYHTVGAEIVGQTSNVAERVITIDDLLIADVFIPLLDEAKNHYEYRSEYSTQCGRALARKFDTNSQQVALLAARASATVTGGNGGTQLTNAGYATTGSTIAAGIFAAAQALDEKDVPEDARVPRRRWTRRMCRKTLALPCSVLLSTTLPRRPPTSSTVIGVVLVCTPKVLS
jgi:hypothetical protein